MGHNTSNKTENSSGFFFRPNYDICLLVLAFFIVAINVFVMALFIRKSYLRTKTNSVLVSLAISDLSTGLLSIPLYLCCSSDNVAICIATAVLYRCVAVSTIFHIFVVTLERYVAVIYPMRYYRMVTKQRVCLVIGFVWLFSIFYALILLIWASVNNDLSDFEDKRKYEIPYQITGIIVCFIVPLVIMVFCFVRMFHAIRHQVNNMRKLAEMAGDPRSRSIASDKRALVIFSTMLGFFVLCWSSWYITMLQANFKDDTIISQNAALVLDFLRFGTSLFNPMIYTLFKHDFRRAVKSRCSCIGKLNKFFMPRDSHLNIPGTMTSELNEKFQLKGSSPNTNIQRYENELEVIKERKQADEGIELISHV